MTNVYDQYSSSTSSSMRSPNTARKASMASISALLNPEPEENRGSIQNTVQTNNHDSYESHVMFRENSGLTITNCRNDQISNIVPPPDSDSLSSPVSPNSKNPYAGNGSSRSTSSSLPSTRRSSMNRSSASDQASINNMITPPQTPGVKSPTKTNFQFPSNATEQSNQQTMPPKVKRKRITQEQLADLVAMFEQTDTPSYDVREKLAKKLNMTNREVQVWFQNRRAKANRAKQNEHNTSHQHHRFLHHHSVPTSQAASGHASSIGMINPGNFTFVPMFTNGGPSNGGPAKGRSNRRHSYVHPPTSSMNTQKKAAQNHPFTRPRASTVTGASMTSHCSSSKTMVPQLKIMPFAPQDQSLHASHHVYGNHAHAHSHTVPPSPVSPSSPSTPILPHPISSHYALPSINSCTLPPVVPPIKDIIGNTDIYHQAPSHMLPSAYNQSQPYTQNTAEALTTMAMPVPSGTKSAIDILATAAEFVQSEEKEKERLKALGVSNAPNETDDNDQKRRRPWLI
ncbi:3776_t:CDS:2 [Acaulospora morrowiae]|uniref:3776_t:CDS:1 n=1 Tax=Acaulospora morrowiae TaxID=94023 RepID=A0A9N9BIU8_9GLOM|nr:3776_t:CDS:2 [Acaulospora morrowiae]